MKRQASPLRPDFAAHAADIGFHFSGADGQIYWDESIRYELSLAQIENDLESATAELGALCLDLVDRVVGNAAALARLNIPRHAQAAIAASWARRDPSLYGRFDFAYDGKGPPKLLEYNADTPTSLFESAVVQWYWLEQLIARGDLPAGADQFNSLHEKLIARWTAIGDGRFLHLACVLESIEDSSTTAYLEECARQAGLRTTLIAIADIGREMRGARDLGFRDRSGRPIELLFKLYPWEWMFGEPSGYSSALPALRELSANRTEWDADYVREAANRAIQAIDFPIAAPVPRGGDVLGETAKHVVRVASKPQRLSPGGLMRHIADAESVPPRECRFVPRTDWIAIVDISQRPLLGPTKGLDQPSVRRSQFET